MKKIALLFFVFLTLSCSENKEINLILNCDGNTVNESTLNGKYYTETKPQSKSYVFKNKKYLDGECKVWTKEKINCFKSVVQESSTESNWIFLDRISGTMKQNILIKSNDKTLTTTEMFEGKCQKSSQKI